MCPVLGGHYTYPPPRAYSFYGYYTIHTLKDGEIEGMLSVHGTPDQAWYHDWHSAFVHMIEQEDPY
jgi:hypothetical protein